MDSVTDLQDKSFDLNFLKEEDCQYILRMLEKRAFEYVVCALRAQGPLSHYKEVILDHLKSILFISDDDFLLRIRLSANDPILSRIAQELNPSYDNMSEWMASGYSLVSLDFPKVLQLNTAPNKNAFLMARKMQEEMAKHNSLLDKEQEALFKLLQLTKVPYVPEKLRRLLQNTEKDIHGRVDVMKEKQINKYSTRHVGRPKRAESVSSANANNCNNIEVETKSKNAAVPTKSDLSTTKHNVSNKNITSNGLSNKSSKFNSMYVANLPVSSNVSVNVSTSIVDKVNNVATNNLHSGSNEVLSVQRIQPISQKAVKAEETEKLHNEFSIHYSGGANVVIVDPEDQNTIKETKVRKRRSKLIDDVTCTCARVLPFIFEQAHGDLPKPPRGNPDKRCSKLKAQTKRASLDFSVNNDVMANAYLPQSHGNSFFSKSLGYINSGATSSSDIMPTPRKRTRTVDDTEDGRFVQSSIYQKNTSRTIINTNNYNTTSALRAQHPYYGTSLNRTYNTGISTLPEHEISSLDHCRNSKVITETSSQSTSAIMTDPVGRLISQDVALTEETVSDNYVNNVYMEPVRISVKCSNYQPHSIEENASGSSIDGNYLDTGEESVSHYTIKNLILQTTVPDTKCLTTTVATVHAEMYNNNTNNSSISKLIKVQKPILQKTVQIPTCSDNIALNSSGLDFLATTASLFTPLQKQSTEALGKSINVVTSTRSEPVTSNFCQISSTLTSKEISAIYTSSIPTKESVIEQPQKVYQQTNNNQQEYINQIVTSQTDGLPLSATSITIPAASVVYVQNAPLSSTSILASTATGDTYIIDYAPQTLASTCSTPHFIQRSSGIANLSVNDIYNSSTTPGTSTSGIVVTRPVTITTTSSETQKTIYYLTHQNKSTTKYSSAKGELTKNFASDSHQATQDFLKQHAIDSNGVPLNEEITLGSILRSSNLRNKLLSAAAVAKTSSLPATSTNFQLHLQQPQTQLSGTIQHLSQQSVQTILTQPSVSIPSSSTLSLSTVPVSLHSNTLKIEESKNNNHAAL